jgi:hypothetical protein
MAASPLRALRGVKYPDEPNFTIVQSNSMVEYSILTSICLPITNTGARYVTKVLHEYVVSLLLLEGKLLLKHLRALLSRLW